MGSFSIWHWTVVLVTIGTLVIPWVLYIRSIQLTIQAIDPEYREASPGSPWLLLIPLFSLIWLFILVSRIRHSFRNLGEAGRLRRPTSGSSDVGLALAICLAISIIPYVNIISGIAAFILWIIHWVGIVSARADIRQERDVRLEPRRGQLVSG